MGNLRVLLLALTVPILIAVRALGEGDVPAVRGGDSAEFATAALPVIQRYCLDCHSTEEQEGDLDLERFTRLDPARNALRVWQRVGEVLAGGEMPPKEARQPEGEERARLRGWVQGFLATEATRRAGDPGRVVLRRLNNAEYTYTIRDLTGLEGLEPAREFPVDGAAGEGFTNTGNSLVMSPMLITKYLDAAKEVASHAVLLPDGFRFEAGSTTRDWTEANLGQVRAFYREFTDPQGGGASVNLQGIVFDTNQGGRLPLDRYLAATITERQALTSGAKSIEVVAGERSLNPRYLGTLWRGLNDPTASLLIRDLQLRWRAAKIEDVPPLVAEIADWQRELWKFSSVGHIGKAGGPKSWMEPSSPLVARHDLRFKIPPALDGGDVTLSLVASDLGDGNEHDFATWQQPRLVAPGRLDLPLRDLRRVARHLLSQRDRLFADAAAYLDAAAEVGTLPDRDAATLARDRGLDPAGLRAWCAALGIASNGAAVVTGHFTTKLTHGGGHEFINGWGSDQLPQLLANSSDQAVRIPGLMKPHGVAVHPTPTIRAAVAWQSPARLTVRVEATTQHAHPECGNGVTWSLELRQGATRRSLADGVAQGSQVGKAGPIEGLAVEPGDVVALAIGPRDGSHACDLTAIDLRLVEVGGSGRDWDLATDVAADVLAGNPHADHLGNPGVWHFFSEPDLAAARSAPPLPPGSVLARWQAERDTGEKHRLALEVQRLLTSNPPSTKDGPDSALVRQLRALDGPLLAAISSARPIEPASAGANWGPDPAIFGTDPTGKPIDPASLCVPAPATLSFRVPAEFAAGAELVTSGALNESLGAAGSVQFKVVAGAPPTEQGPHAGDVAVTLTGASWTSTTRQTSYAAPIVVNPTGATRERVEAALDDFRQLFPAALCYSKIVPVDEVVTLTLFHREDGQLARLMLDDGQKARLDRLWDELHFISRDALTLVDAYAQLMEFATQDGDPRVFEPLRRPINDRASAFRLHLAEAEPHQLDALLAFAARAYRRTLTVSESSQLRGLYGKLRAEEMTHDEAFRLTLARVLVAPAFLYRAETPVAGVEPGPVSADALATRLSYFLWSSAPDQELRELARTGKLREADVLASQARRMLLDGRIRRLATEFACQWLQIADLDHLEEKSERHFPTFLPLRSAMLEESVRFFTDLFQTDGSILGILDADHTFLNPALAEHYGVPVGPNDGWRRVEGVERFGRGGVLAQAATLAKQSGASRTSPTLRGNWISEVLLGERLPRPPKGVPQLPDDESAGAGLTVRQLVERHASNPKCATCHERIDPLGFALEGFDAIGRLRTRDGGDRPIDTHSQARDGAQFDGIDGLRDYLLTTRREAFVNQFCRKLLGYALGRSTELADAPLLAEIRAALGSNGHRIGPAVEVIVRSQQFRQIRGRDSADTD